MNFSTKQQVIWGTVSFVGVAFIAWGVWSQVVKTSVPASPGSDFNTASSTSNGASTTTVPASPAPRNVSTKPFPINKSDTIASWNFKGSYTGNDTLVAQANADITYLSGLLGKGKYDDYSLYNGIANDYASLGNGTVAYQNYNRAIQIHPNLGLAYTNLAHLMDGMGAYYTAADAYGKAVAVEPGMLEYHLERLTYLTRQFPSDTVRITAALTDASKQFGDNASILSIEAQWLTGQGRYADAIKAWQTVKMLSPGKDTSAIDAEIARLEAKK